MPTLTRESRALLPLVLSVVLLAGGFYDLAFVAAGALSWLSPLLPVPLFSVVLAALLLALSVGLLLLARSAAAEGPRDAWHHVAVVATWTSLLLVVTSAAAVVGAMLSQWPTGSPF